MSATETGNRSSHVQAARVARRLDAVVTAAVLRFSPRVRRQSHRQHMHEEARDRAWFGAYQSYWCPGIGATRKRGAFGSPICAFWPAYQ
jgi:hypothetical protein